MRPIDADALKEELCKEYRHFSQRIAISQVFEAIKKAPTIDAVPVVRCQDCQWYDTTHPCGTMFPNSFFCKFYRTFNPQSHFCAVGTRRNTDA